MMLYRSPQNAITETPERVNRNSIKMKGEIFMKQRMSWATVFSIATYVIIAIASDLMANKMLNIFGLTLAGGILCIGISFTARDMVHRCIGFENAKRLVWATALVNLAIAALLVVLDYLPSAIPGQQEAWHSLMGSSWRIIIASFIAQLVADLSDTYVFEWFTRKFGDKKTWLRVAGSNVVSTFFDSILFSMIAFLGVLPTEVIWASALSAFAVKFILAELATPIAYITNKVEYTAEN